MVNEGREKRARRKRRALGVRSLIVSTGNLRLSVFRSSKHIYAQIIDDQRGVTLLGLGSYSKEFRDQKGKKELAKEIGFQLAKRAREKNVEKVIFDRRCFTYHGRLAALADGAREGGLIF